MAKDENGIKVCKNCGSKGPFNKGSNKKDHLSSYCVPRQLYMDRCFIRVRLLL